MHPQAIDAFDTYFQPRSIFTNANTNDIWATSITLVYWYLQEPATNLDLNQDSVSNERSRFYEKMRNRGIFPASNVKKLDSIQQVAKGSAANLSDKRSVYIEERSAVLVFTGTPDGHLWICSLWSSLVDDESLEREIENLRSTLQMFKNQPRTGRVLAFLHLLGIVCLQMTKMTEKILQQLEDYTNLGVCIHSSTTKQVP